MGLGGLFSFGRKLGSYHDALGLLAGDSAKESGSARRPLHIIGIYAKRNFYGQ